MTRAHVRRGEKAQRLVSAFGVALSMVGAATTAVAVEASEERFEPERTQFELGAILGVFLPSAEHNLRHEAARPEEYAGAALELGLRAAFLPIPYLGGEFEGVWMPTSTDNDGTASLFAGRAHLIGQVPFGRIVPFVLAGGGALGGASNRMGTDTDPAIHFGLGAKYAVSEGLGVRLDLRDTLTQRISTPAEPAEDGDVTSHFEVLLGATFALTPRRLP